MWWSRVRKRKPNFRRGEADFGKLAGCAGASQAGWPRREAVKRRAATARERVEAAKLGVKKRVNLRAKYAVRRASIVMAWVEVVDGLRRV